MNEQSDIDITKNTCSPKEIGESEELGEKLSLKEVIQEQAIEDEAPLSSKFSLRKILGGDLLNTGAIRRQIWLAHRLFLSALHCQPLQLPEGYYRNR